MSPRVKVAGESIIQHRYMRSIEFHLLPVPPILRKDVACISIVEYSGEERLSINVAPNSVPGIVFQHQNGRSALERITTSSGHNSVAPTLFLYGPGTDPSVMNYASGSYTTTHVILKPHALNTLMGINAASLIDGFVELDEFSAEDLNGRLIEADDDQRRISLLTDFLIAQLKQEKPRDRVVEEALRFVHNNIASVTVKHLLEHLSLSERQFERRFSQTVGIAPQSYIRVKRFHAALRLIKAGHYERLTDVAYALNFYDQSHLIRDIKAFSGLTPKKLSQQANDFYHEQTGYSYL